MAKAAVDGTKPAVGAAMRRPPGRKSGGALNALRHGLTARKLYGAYAGRVEELAAALLSGVPRTEEAWLTACEAAEAHLLLRHINEEVYRLLRDLEDDRETFAYRRKTDSQYHAGLLGRQEAGRPIAGKIMQDLVWRMHKGPPQNATRRQTTVYLKAKGTLSTYARYEASAYRRRQEAMGRLNRLLAAA